MPGLSDEEGDPALAHTGCQLLVGEAEVLDELLIRGRLFERVEVLAVQDLDQGLFEGVGVFDLAHDGGDVLQSGPLGRAPATLARDQLEATVAGAAVINCSQIGTLTATFNCTTQGTLTVSNAGMRVNWWEASTGWLSVGFLRGNPCFTGRAMVPK